MLYCAFSLSGGAGQAGEGFNSVHPLRVTCRYGCLRVCDLLRHARGTVVSLKFSGTLGGLSCSSWPSPLSSVLHDRSDTKATRFDASPDETAFLRSARASWTHFRVGSFKQKAGVSPVMRINIATISQVGPDPTNHTSRPQNTHFASLALSRSSDWPLYSTSRYFPGFGADIHYTCVRLSGLSGRMRPASIVAVQAR